MLKYFLGAALACILAVNTRALADVPVPPFRAFVTDLTGTLADSQRAALEEKLSRLSQTKGSQVAVLIISTTAPETIEQFAIKTAENWKLGRKDQDDGVLLLVAKTDRTARIEVGYGLEGAIPDVYAKRVIEETLVPAFRGGDFYGGIDKSTDALISLISGENLPPPAAVSPRISETFVPVLFGALIFSNFLGAVMRPFFGSVWSAAGAGAIVFLVSIFLLPWIISLIVGLIGFILALVAGNAPRSSSGRSGGWSTSSGGWSSSSGGGGFSGGGGGSFGGGGASGRW